MSKWLIIIINIFFFSIKANAFTVFLFQDFILDHYSEEPEKYEKELDLFENMRKVVHICFQVEVKWWASFTGYEERGNNIL